MPNYLLIREEKCLKTKFHTLSIDMLIVTHTYSFEEVIIWTVIKSPKLLLFKLIFSDTFPSVS